MIHKIIYWIQQVIRYIYNIDSKIDKFTQRIIQNIEKHIHKDIKNIDIPRRTVNDLKLDGNCEYYYGNDTKLFDFQQPITLDTPIDKTIIENELIINNQINIEMEILNKVVSEVGSVILHDTSKDKPAGTFITVSNNVITIQLQDGNIADVGINGVTPDVVLELAQKLVAVNTPTTI